MIRPAAALLAALFLFAAGPALAAPTAACLWGGLNSGDQAAVSEVVLQGGDMAADLADRVQSAVQGCGFEATDGGRYRSSFLLGLMVYRLQAEASLLASSQVAATSLDHTWQTLDPAWKNSLRAYIITRYQRREAPLPEADRVTGLAAQLHVTGQAVNVLRSYLFLRASVDYVEAEGPAFRPQPPSGAPSEAPAAAE